MICPGCGCDSFQEAYSKDNVLEYKYFCCAVGCGCGISVRDGKITVQREVRYMNYLRMLKIEFPYYRKFVKQYNKKFYNGN